MSTSQAANNTTILLPPSPYSVFVAYAHTTSPLTPNQTPTGPAQSVVTCSEGFALYVPYARYNLSDVNIPLLVGELAAATNFSNLASATVPPIEVPQAGLTRVLLPSPEVLPGLIGISTSITPINTTSGTNTVNVSASTLYIPYTPPLPATINAALLMNSLFDVPTSNVTDLNVAPRNLPVLETSTSVIPASGTDTSKSADKPTSTALSSGNSTTASLSPTRAAKGATEGAVAGGTVGGFFLGLLVCLLAALWYIRRRAHRSTAMSSTTRDPQRRKPLPSDLADDKEAQISVVDGFVTGWQKHLPQEKDDKTIEKTFSTIFEQVQIHMEGFYEAKSGKLSSMDDEHLARVASESITKMLRRAKNAVPLLEAILVRWTVERISLRLDAEESLLPSEYLEIPSVNDWHMENEGSKAAAESTRGFLQAFSQWRRLTAFLRQDAKAEAGFQEILAAKIDAAVQDLEEAFAPWQIPRKSPEGRAESLRSILHQASDAGILLFAQPSTFMFDWSRTERDQDGDVVISPTLVKRLDEYGHPLHPTQVLIKARSAKV